jgi:hypothetical protein
MQSYNQQDPQTPHKVHVLHEGKPPLLPKYVIMIIVLAVVLAAIFFLFISSEEDDTDNLTYGFVWKKNPENPDNYIGYYEGIKSTLYLDDCTVTASHGGSSDSMGLDLLAGESQMTVGDMTLDFIDLEPFGKFGSNDIFIVYGGETGDVVRVVYKPTSGSMTSKTLP